MTVFNSEDSRPPFFWFLCSYIVILTFIFCATAIVIYRYGWQARSLGWNYELRAGNFYVKQIDPHGPAAAKLQEGDRIVAINGRADFETFSNQGERIIRIAEETYSIEVLRASQNLKLQLDVSVVRDLRCFFSMLTIFLASLISACVAILVGLSRPDHRTVQLFSFTCLSMSLIQLIPLLAPVERFLGTPEIRLSQLIWLFSWSPLLVASGYHFYFRFCDAGHGRQPWTFLKHSFYLCAGILLAFYTVLRLLIIYDPATGNRFAMRNLALFAGLQRVFEVMMIFAMGAIFAVVAQNYHRIKETDRRRRIRWTVYGSTLGVFPMLLYYLLEFLSGLHAAFAPSPGLHQNLFLIAMLSLVLIPVTVGYAILKNRMFDVHIVVRRGVHYLMAKGSLQILIWFPVAFILYKILSNPGRSVPDLLFSNSSYLFLAVAAFGGLLLRKNLLELLDRKFFRNAYNSEKILITLVNEIANFHSISEMAAWVSLQLESALHPKRILVYYRQKHRGALTLAYSSGEHKDPQIPEDSEFLRIAERDVKSQDLLYSGKYELPGEEKEWLREQDIHLMVPLTDPDHHLHGVLLLGEKRSEEPYSANDRKLLEALAGQMGLAYQNLILRERVDRDRKVQEEVLAHLTGQRKNLVKECPDCGACYDSSELFCPRDQEELVLSLPVERTIDQKYRLDRLIGKGGMGAVYQATDLRLNRQVAIKIMVGSMFGNRAALRRFEREARTSAGLNHPNVITVYDFGGTGEGGFLVMELVKGFTLRHAIQEKGNLPPDIVADLFEQILEGVQAAHQMGIIHRDLKPENVLVTRDEKNRPLVKILDFGLAKSKLLDGSQSASLTAPGTIIGTLHYMSPEQIMGGDVDERTDFFSIGVMLIEALTGSQPFLGDTPTKVALAIIQKPFQLEGDARELKSLNAVLQKSIAKIPDQRFSSAAEMQRELIPIVRGCPAFPSPKQQPITSPSTPTDSILF